MKEVNKFKRTFIGRGTCTGAVYWSANVSKSYDQKKYPGKMTCGGEFGVNKDGMSHWVESRKDMRAMYRLQKELNDFICMMEAALDDVEAHNKALGLTREQSNA